ncbi:MAG: TIGR02186 family protein [Pseudomonadota bacterium]
MKGLAHSARPNARRILAGLLAAGAALVAGLWLTSARSTPQLEEQLLSDSAQTEVAINATFAGSELFIYGAIARNRFLEEGDRPPDIIIVVRGPSSPVVVRKKDRVAGLWMNREAIRIASAPSYYAVASTRPVPIMLQPREDATYRITLDKAIVIAGLPTSAQDPEEFRQALIRLRRARGLYRDDGAVVTLTGGTLYQTRLKLPADIVEGDYEVRVYLVRDREVRDQTRIQLPVRKIGVERLMFTAAQETPLLYGFLSLLSALIAGFGASELFKRLKR